jgi:Xaa-Pro aminopeptidase
MKNIKLLIDSPSRNSDLIYSGGYYCLDSIIIIETENKKIGFFPSTELELAKKNSNVKEIYNLSTEFMRIKNEQKYPPLKSSIVIEWMINNGYDTVIIPANFPVIEFTNLKSHGFNVAIIEGEFHHARVSKNRIELDHIRDNSKKNVEVMDEVKRIIADSAITNDRKLKYQGQILTSEYLQNFILMKFIEKGMMADSVIVAVGDQGCSPHDNGHGDIFADTSIIVDIYPRSRDNHYYTDMTRTFCKGKATDELKKMYECVHDAQKLVFDKIHADADGKLIHEAVLNFFRDKGYKSGTINGYLQGFFHGTGHGLGLECHESPYISLNGEMLPENSVVSNEPGLYYLGIGGVRIEDLILVTKSGFENLTNYEKILEIE